MTQLGQLFRVRRATELLQISRAHDEASLEGRDHRVVLLHLRVKGLAHPGDRFGYLANPLEDGFGDLVDLLGVHGEGCWRTTIATDHSIESRFVGPTMTPAPWRRIFKQIGVGVKGHTHRLVTGHEAGDKLGRRRDDLPVALSRNVFTCASRSFACFTSSGASLVGVRRRERRFEGVEGKLRVDGDARTVRAC